MSKITKLTVEYKDGVFSDPEKLIAHVGDVQIHANIVGDVAQIDRIELKKGTAEVYGEWVSEAFTLFKRRDDVDHCEFET